MVFCAAFWKLGSHWVAFSRRLRRKIVSVVLIGGERRERDALPPCSVAFLQFGQRCRWDDIFSAVVLKICTKIDLFFEKLDKVFCVFRPQFWLVYGLRTWWWRPYSSGGDSASKIVQVVAVWSRLVSESLLIVGSAIVLVGSSAFGTRVGCIPLLIFSYRFVWR